MPETEQRFECGLKRKFELRQCGYLQCILVYDSHFVEVKLLTSLVSLLVVFIIQVVFDPVLVKLIASMDDFAIFFGIRGRQGLLKC